MAKIGNYDQTVAGSSAEERQFSEDLYNQIAEHEGVKQYVYLDTEDKPTIGVGFNLTQPHNQRIIKQMGYNPQDLISGKVRLTESEIKRLYNESVTQAFNDARKWLPNFDEQPADVRKALIDMSFNLGFTKLNKFEKAQAALMQKNYKTAAAEMLDSKWAKQVKGRAQTLASMVRKHSK